MAARAVVLRRRRVGAQARHARRADGHRPPVTGRLRRHRRRVLPRRDGRQDADRDGDARGEVSVARRRRSSARRSACWPRTLPSCSPASWPPTASRSRRSASPPRCFSPRSASGCSSLACPSRRSERRYNRRLAANAPDRRLMTHRSIPPPSKPPRSAAWRRAATLPRRRETPAADGQVLLRVDAARIRRAGCTWGTCATTRSTT